jgi:uncharacterized protein YgiM (DUF1202 family)
VEPTIWEKMGMVSRRWVFSAVSVAAFAATALGMPAVWATKTSPTTTTPPTATTAAKTKTATTQATSTAATAKYVVTVSSTSRLKVRSAAGVGHKVIARLANGTSVTATGKTVRIGTVRWRQIRIASGLGWVDGTFLTKA